MARLSCPFTHLNPGSPVAFSVRSINYCCKLAGIVLTDTVQFDERDLA